MDTEEQFICFNCGQTYSITDRRWRCDCGGALDLQFEVQFDIKKTAARDADIWRYREALPVNSGSAILSLGEGFTPLLRLYLAGKTVFIKQDHLFPTGSYKDRGAAVMVSKIKELGITEVVEDSSGNAGAAIAAYCAMAGIACHIYVPESTSPGKIAQIKAYGARLHKISGSREDAAQAAMKAAEHIYYASHCWNPYFIHGTKTFAFEICEQLGWHAPDSVVLPAGNGTLLLGAFIGFAELKKAQIINNVPRLIAVQAENCSPLYHLFKNDLSKWSGSGVKETIAEGIAIARPVRGQQIVEAVRQTGGDILTVNEQEIKASLDEMCKSGFYIEPTAAAAIAGARKYLENAGGEELVVTTFTGHGLKASESIKSLS
jgi:threonine synthase